MRVVVIISLLAIGACGQKGQLYLPGPEEAEVAVPADQSALPLPEQPAAPPSETEDEKNKKD